MVSRYRRSCGTFNAVESSPHASVAQGIEHRSPKAGVVRSNRTGGTIVSRRSLCVFRMVTFRFPVVVYGCRGKLGENLSLHRLSKSLAEVDYLATAALQDVCEQFRCAPVVRR